MNRYLDHFCVCENSTAVNRCVPATLKDPVCRPCPEGARLWSAHQRYQNMCAASEDRSGPDPSCYPLGGLDEYND